MVYAILYGSRAGGVPVKGDWDVAVLMEEPEEAPELQLALARHLGVRELDVDLLVLNRPLPCTLVVEVYARGRLVYARDVEEYLDHMLRTFKPCLDFLMDAKKLGLTEVQARAVTGRWRR